MVLRGCLPGGGVGAQILAALRAFLVSLLRRQGDRKKAASVALRFLGLYAV